jgi:hypothetical protein
MSKHTPGPWHYYYTSAAQARARAQNGTDGGGAAGSIQAGPPGMAATLIAFALHHRDPSEDAFREANMRLMAAAPDLLEALTALLSYTRACEDMLNVRPSATTHPEIKAARSAIAKATGNP